MTGLGEPVFVIDRSALPVATVVVAVPVSLPEFGSTTMVELILATAVLVRMVPWAVLGATWTMIWNVATAPEANVAAVALTVPVPPAAGVDNVNAGPAVCDADTNVVFAGTASLKVMLRAVFGPVLVSVTM